MLLRGKGGLTKDPFLVLMSGMRLAVELQVGFLRSLATADWAVKAVLLSWVFLADSSSPLGGLVKTDLPCQPNAILYAFWQEKEETM